MRRLFIWPLLLGVLALALAPAPRPVAAVAPSPGNPCATQPGSYKLLVDRPGIYEVTLAMLAAAGWSAPLEIGQLRLFRGACVAANEVAIERSSGAVRFYGEPSRSRYSRASVYWLRQESAVGLEMATRSVALASPAPPLQTTAVITAEGILSRLPLYDTVFPGDDGDHFYAADIRGGVTVPMTFTLSSGATGSAALQLHLQGLTTGQHRLRLTLDGVASLPDQIWNGATNVLKTIALVPSQLATGAHVLKLSIPADAIDAVELDRAELAYPAQLVASANQTIFDGASGARRYSVGGFAGPEALLYDTRDPLRPVRLTNATVGASVVWQDGPAQRARYALLAPGQVLRPAIVADAPSQLAQGQADYLIVGYGPFLPATKPLADYYRGKGLRVATVDAQDIYDEFNGGELHPEAIRSFLRYAYASWTQGPGNTPPTYVLLVGDGSYDFRDRFGMGAGWTGFLPPYLADVDPWMKEAACDSCYGRVRTDDPRTQPLPDLLVGRLPVDSLAQAQIVVSKTLGYLTSPPAGAWQTTGLFLSDNYLDQSGQPVATDDFAADAERLLGALPPGPVARRFFFDPSPGGVGKLGRYRNSDLLRADFLRAWDQGAALVAYVGHANYWQWADTSPSAVTPWLWYVYDADARVNGGRLPMLLTLTCLTGFFHEPSLSTTDERLLTWPGGGIVASLSPAGKGVATGHDLFGRSVLRALYSRDPSARSLGAAQRAGFAALQASGNYLDLTFTYTLLGDPAVHLPFVPTSWSFLPVVRR
jgi:Peptidase family C25